MKPTQSFLTSTVVLISICAPLHSEVPPKVADWIPEIQSVEFNHSRVEKKSHNMSSILIQYSLAVHFKNRDSSDNSTVDVIKEECNEGKLNYDYQNLEIVKELDTATGLAVDYSDNILYFSYRFKPKNYTINDIDGFKIANINLKTNEFKNIELSMDPFTQTVNQKTHDVYFATNYRLTMYGNDTEFHDVTPPADDYDKIKYVYLHDDVLYYIKTKYIDEASTGESYIKVNELSNSSGVRVELQDIINIGTFVMDNDTVFYSNVSGFYSRPKIANRSSVFYKDIEVRGMTTDVNERVYVFTTDGIYVVNKKKEVVEKVLDVDNVIGLAFDNENNMIYSNATSLIRLKPKPSSSC